MSKKLAKQAKQIREMVAAYGADRQLWPETVRDFADETAAALPEIAALLQQAEKEDALLRDYHLDIPALDNLQSRILAEARATPQLRSSPVSAEKVKQSFWQILFPGLQFRPMHIFAPSGGLAMAAVFGFWLSFSGTVAPPDGTAANGLLLDPVFYQNVSDPALGDALLLYGTEGGMEE
ncbi:MAG: hypothetical protein HND56_04050 [Pseudomonadota bacterium]|nr:hypothetical protein [Pseudomonadota bacterium]QKK04913.1 MAG: hypothetical protein HND56_04050 [Pseudomonadota bacterium]